MKKIFILFGVFSALFVGFFSVALAEDPDPENPTPETTSCDTGYESDIGGKCGCTEYTGTADWWCNRPNGYNLYLENNPKYKVHAYSQNDKLKVLLGKYNEEHQDKLNISLSFPSSINEEVLSGVKLLLKEYSTEPLFASGNNNMYKNYFEAKLCDKIYTGEQSITVQELGSDGNCAAGFYKDTWYDCCIKYQSFCDTETGYINLNTSGQLVGVTCKECTDGLVPNEDHSRCICNSEEKCCGIQLYLGIPFIGDCIEMNSTASSRPGVTNVTNVSAFPILMQGLMKILMSVILVFSFLLVIVSGLMMTAGAFPKSSSFEKGKTLIKNVIISLILLGLSGLILKLINPSFFGG